MSASANPAPDTPPEPTRRLFVALWPDDSARHAIAHLAKSCRGGRLVPAEHLHLTLAFLGATPESKEAAYRAALDGLAFAPFELRLDVLGWWRGPRVLWLGAASMPPELLRLAAEVNARLASRGYRPETRPFAAHVTLVRKHPGPAPAFGTRTPVRWHADRVALVESAAEPAGTHYRPLRLWRAEARSVPPSVG